MGSNSWSLLDSRQIPVTLLMMFRESSSESGGCPIKTRNDFPLAALPSPSKSGSSGRGEEVRNIRFERGVVVAAEVADDAVGGAGFGGGGGGVGGAEAGDGGGEAGGVGGLGDGDGAGAVLEGGFGDGVADAGAAADDEDVGTCEFGDVFALGDLGLDHAQ
ncbi:uncharacterized protein BKCO1_4900049 [Diplodia corticola]|uniref:Uncharacterized protein n=1 Tax=Diplodia corticola TaxID=236234 RepID=A0A1J9RTZ2_9PEZI|nr:uncharacterized protein BKCO1_4900049 [Diplodia corticola]OJD31332.1 hypothetical protein BKCO1_4900049 [Diplodia corticola]